MNPQLITLAVIMDIQLRATKFHLAYIRILRIMGLTCCRCYHRTALWIDEYKSLVDIPWRVYNSCANDYRCFESLLRKNKLMQRAR
jgi:hypothetical protein